jgi:hypothetical protein
VADLLLFLRLAWLLSSARYGQLLLSGVMGVIFHLSLFMLIVTYFYAVTGVELLSAYHTADPADAYYNEYGCGLGFETLGCAFLVLFQAITGSNWHEAMNGVIDVAGYPSAVYFVTFYVLVNLTLMDLLVAVTIEAFLNAKRQFSGVTADDVFAAYVEIPPEVEDNSGDNIGPVNARSTMGRRGRHERLAERDVAERDVAASTLQHSITAPTIDSGPTTSHTLGTDQVSKRNGHVGGDEEEVKVTRRISSAGTPSTQDGQVSDPAIAPVAQGGHVHQSTTWHSPAPVKLRDMSEKGDTATQSEAQSRAARRWRRAVSKAIASSKVGPSSLSSASATVPLSSAESEPIFTPDTRPVVFRIKRRRGPWQRELAGQQEALAVMNEPDLKKLAKLVKVDIIDMHYRKTLERQRRQQAAEMQRITARAPGGPSQPSRYGSVNSAGAEDALSKISPILQWWAEGRRLHEEVQEAVDELRKHSGATPSPTLVRRRAPGDSPVAFDDADSASECTPQPRRRRISLTLAPVAKPRHSFFLGAVAEEEDSLAAVIRDFNANYGAVAKASPPLMSKASPRLRRRSRNALDPGWRSESEDSDSDAEAVPKSPTLSFKFGALRGVFRRFVGQVAEDPHLCTL